MSDYLIQQETMEGIANQVRRLSNTEGLYNAAEILELLSKIQGSLGTSEGDITIEAIDYDGTVLKTANLSEGQVFALPDNPVHEGLIFRGWTAPTATVGNFITANEVSFSIAPMYSTESGATEFDVVTTSASQTVTIPEMVGATSIDWGDGSTTQTTTTHTYATAGSYTIKVYEATEITGTLTSAETSIVEARLADSIITLNYAAFRYREGLKSISLSINIESLYSYSFFGCKELVTLILPPKITEITGDEIVSQCTKLVKIIFPINLKSFTSKYPFKSCTALDVLVLPDSIDTIGNYTYYYPSGILQYFGTVDYNNMFFYSSTKEKYFVMMYMGSVPSSGEVVLPEGVKVLKPYLFNSKTTMIKLTIPDSVKKIPKNCCVSCFNLDEVILPNTLEEIGEFAFDNCTALNNIEIPDTVVKIGYECFVDSGLKSIKLPDGLKTLGGSCFKGCTELESIVIPESLDDLGNQICDGCTLLKSVILPFCLPEDVDSYEWNNTFEGAFRNCSSLTNVTLSPDLLYIVEEMFLGCSSLINLDFLSSMTKLKSIGNSAFRGCTGLTSVVIPDSVTTIYEDAFRDCKNLTEIDLKNVTSLGTGALSNTGITSFHIPAGLSLWTCPISGCTDLETITIDSNNTSMIVKDGMLLRNGYREVLGMTKDAVIPTDGSVTTLGEGLFKGDESLTEYSIPNGIKYIERYCFEDCINLQSITISNTVVDINYEAFRNTGLVEIIIPDTVLSIDRYCFADCKVLETVKLPSGLTSLEDSLFNGCSKLSAIDIPKTVTSIGSNVFDGTILSSVIIPKSVTEIGYRAFDIRSLQSAVYEGTEEEWANVTVASGNTRLTNILTFTGVTTNTTE